MREGVAAIRRALRRQALPRRGPGILTVSIAAAGLVLAAAACGRGGADSAVGSTPVQGGTATFALQPTETPNFIFPLIPAAYFTSVNTDNFQYLMYRPLYWFGTGNQPTLNTELSLAYAPVYHGRDVTIRLKGNYRWSNGQPVTARDVVFWINLLAKDSGSNSSGTTGWGGYVPGAFPSNVSDVRAVSPTVVSMVMNSNYSTTWFTDNELSQITPLPQAWDRTAAGASDCTVVQADCPAVYRYLMSQALNTSTYASSPLWGIVDGPWRLTGFSGAGNITFRYNPAYSGPVPRDHVSTFVEESFTTEQAEYNILQAGGTGQLDVGYLPSVDAPVPPAGNVVGQNPLPGYQLSPLYAWGLNFFPYNFANTGMAGHIFAQIYFRQAVQFLVDQEGVIDGPLHGYGKVTVGPVGDYPVTRYLSPTGRGGDPFTFNPSAAQKLLTDNGWNVVPNGVTTCALPGSSPGECGAGITRGTPLTFSLVYDTGISWVESSVKELASNASEVGITINLTGTTFDNVIAQSSPCTGTGSCTWELADWGGGWTYSPDYLPTGEELFQSGSEGNTGDYASTTDNSMIQQTLHTASLVPFYSWEDYLAKQLPVVWQPDAPSQLTESADNLHTGILSPTLTLTPEDWYFLR